MNASLNDSGADETVALARRIGIAGVRPLPDNDANTPEPLDRNHDGADEIIALARRCGIAGVRPLPIGDAQKSADSLIGISDTSQPAQARPAPTPSRAESVPAPTLSPTSGPNAKRIVKPALSAAQTAERKKLVDEVQRTSRSTGSVSPMREAMKCLETFDRAAGLKGA